MRELMEAALAKQEADNLQDLARCVESASDDRPKEGLWLLQVLAHALYAVGYGPENTWVLLRQRSA